MQKLTFVKFCYKKKSKNYCEYLCSCGKTKITREDGVKGGYVNSCGCSRKERMLSNNPTKTHGMSHSRFYQVWSNLKNRCDNKKYRLYKDYGGRGIGYDPSWKTFSNFHRDMFPSYREGLTIDRVDNDKGYSKKNCRWVDMFVQNNNKRNIKLYFDGDEHLNITQLSKKYNIKKSTLSMRITTYKWDLLKAINKK